MTSYEKEHSDSYQALMNAYNDDQNQSLPDFKASPFASQAMDDMANPFVNKTQFKSARSIGKVSRRSSKSKIQGMISNRNGLQTMNTSKAGKLNSPYKELRKENDLIEL